MPEISREINRAVQIPHPLEDFDNQIPSSAGPQRFQMPGVCQGGGKMLKLWFGGYIIFIEWAWAISQPQNNTTHDTL